MPFAFCLFFLCALCGKAQTVFARMALDAKEDVPGLSAECLLLTAACHFYQFYPIATFIKVKVIPA